MLLRWAAGWQGGRDALIAGAGDLFVYARSGAASRVLVCVCARGIGRRTEMEARRMRDLGCDVGTARGRRTPPLFGIAVAKARTTTCGARQQSDITSTGARIFGRKEQPATRSGDALLLDDASPEARGGQSESGLPCRFASRSYDHEPQE
jgi:hypothetical protein